MAKKSKTEKREDIYDLGGPYKGKFKLTKTRKETLVKLYYFLRLTRDLDDRMRKLFRQGRFQGTFFSQIGQECTTVVPGLLAEKEDFFGPSHRELGCLIAKGVEPKVLICQVYAKSGSQDKGVMHPCFWGDTSVRQITPCTCLATQVPLAAGAALSYKMRGLPFVAYCFTGEGATSKGDFHESLNFAAIHKLPLIYTIQNNWYAESVPLSIQCGNVNLEERAEGYNIAGVRVSDGNDAIWMLAVYEEAIKRAKTGGGPTLIMADTYRWHGHSEIDPADYRPDEEVEQWMALDPIPRFEGYLTRNNVMTEAEIEEVKVGITNTIEDAVKFAEESPPAPAEFCLENVYAPDDFENPLSQHSKVVATEI